MEKEIRSDKSKLIKSENKKQRFPIKWMFLVGAIAVLGIFVGVWALSPAPANKDIDAGVAYLKSLEEKDMAVIQQEINRIKKEAWTQALAEGTLPLWAQFNDAVIFGDSRAVGFFSYGFLDESKVLADGGFTIANIPEYIEQMKSMNPSHLFLCTGINDIGIGYWETPEAYVTAFEEQMQELKAALPDTQIYINSIFPAQGPALLETSKGRDRIPEYNVAVKAWCEEKGYKYIDNTQVYEEHKDLYDIDGIHLKKEIYEFWAMQMLSEVDIWQKN